MKPSDHMEDEFVPPSTKRLCVIRHGHQVVRQWHIPKPVVLVDTREQMPWCFLDNHPNWIGGEKRLALTAGDYSVEGMQDVLALERKSMPDAIRSTTADRARFIRSCARLAQFRWKAILIEATYEDMKSSYANIDGLETEAHPNAVVGTLDAIEAKFGIPVLYTSRVRNLAEERAASWLSKHFTYWWLEEHGHGRVLIDEDGL
jgi:ERCC4-type nuclease